MDSSDKCHIIYDRALWKSRYDFRRYSENIWRDYGQHIYCRRTIGWNSIYSKNQSLEWRDQWIKMVGCFLHDRSWEYLQFCERRKYRSTCSNAYMGCYWCNGNQNRAECRWKSRHNIYSEKYRYSQQKGLYRRTGRKHIVYSQVIQCR